MHGRGRDGGQARGLIEPAATIAGAEIRREHFCLRVVLDQKADRHATVRAAIPDAIEPLPGGQWLSAVDPLDKDEGRKVRRVHAQATALLGGQVALARTAMVAQLY